MKKHRNTSFLFILLLLVSLLFNVILVFAYRVKYLPKIYELERKIETVSQTNEEGDLDCVSKVYSRSEGRVVCLTKPKALELCSKEFTGILQSESSTILKEIGNIDELDKLRDLKMKICMQDKGFEY